MQRRRFELKEGTSAKFWEVEVDGKTVRVHFGRLGTAGQTRDKQHPSASAAASDAEKLIREKVGKGYREMGGDAPEPATPAPPTKVSKKKASEPTPVDAVRPPTGDFGWTPQIDALFANGFPFLRILTDEVVAPKAAIREAKKACQANDPYFQVHIPRDVAVRYLAGYPFNPYEDDKAMVAAMENPPSVDLALFDRILATQLAPVVVWVNDKRVNETYDFRIAEVLFLFEAFLGSEVVLQRAVAHLVAAREHTESWGDDAYFVDHENNNVARMIAPLGWFRFRMPAARFRELVAPLEGAAPALPKYVARLKSLIDDEAPVANYLDLPEIGMQRRSKELLLELTKRFPYWNDPQFYFVMGKDHLLVPDVKKLKQEPKWQQVRYLEEFGIVRAPGVARMFAVLLESRSVGKEAAAWLDARRAWIESEALPVLDRADANAAKVLRAHFGGAALVPASKSAAELEAELATMLAGVGPALKNASGDRDKELAILADAFAHYQEIRAALGDESPDAYFTHNLGDLVPSWKVDRETSIRWMELAVAATGFG